MIRLWLLWLISAFVTGQNLYLNLTGTGGTFSNATSLSVLIDVPATVTNRYEIGSILISYYVSGANPLSHMSINLHHVNSATFINIWNLKCTINNNAGVNATVPFILFDAANKTATAGSCNATAVYSRPENNMIEFLKNLDPTSDLRVEFKCNTAAPAHSHTVGSIKMDLIYLEKILCGNS